jgi:hypothetical protein
MKNNSRESTIESAVVRYARRQGVRCVKLAGSHDRGKPDRMFLLRNRVMFMELKRPGGKPTALQLKWQEELTAEGFVSLIIDNIKDGCDAVDTFISQTP